MALYETKSEPGAEQWRREIAYHTSPRLISASRCVVALAQHFHASSYSTPQEGAQVRGDRWRHVALSETECELGAEQWRREVAYHTSRCWRCLAQHFQFSSYCTTRGSTGQWPSVAAHGTARAQVRDHGGARSIHLCPHGLSHARALAQHF